jgi:radical SAM enzyme (TIGR01210 family)
MTAFPQAAGGPLAPSSAPDRADSFPTRSADRDRFVLARRPARTRPDPWHHHEGFVERERTASGEIAVVATVFLAGRECPWRCTMCDLWMYAAAGDTPHGALPAQLRGTLSRLATSGCGAPSQAKLYNAGSFFDPRAVPEADYDALAGALGGVSHVIVESHPAMVGDRVERWRAALGRAGGPSPASLEVAMGLETVHPVALDRLNKRMTPEGFARAAEWLRARDVAVRAFVLVNPPFVPAGTQDDWLAASVDFAFACGATVVSLIPTRAGNGTLEALAGEGAFAEPTLDDLERSFERALARARGRVFADLWNLERFATCTACLGARRERLAGMNLLQRTLPACACAACGRSS